MEASNPEEPQPSNPSLELGGTIASITMFNLLGKNHQNYEYLVEKVIKTYTLSLIFLDFLF